jgi:hypothetical protein
MDSVFPAGPSSEYEMPLLRHIYGLPLCKESDSLDAVILASLCEALGFSSDLPDLHDHVLDKLEELLVGLLRGIDVESGPRPRDLDQKLEPFLKQLGNLFKPEHVDEKIVDSALLEIAAKVCCTHFTILGVSLDFKAFCLKHSKLLWYIMSYSAFHGGDVLNAGFGIGV